jgi:hypothetical protein
MYPSAASISSKAPESNDHFHARQVRADAAVNAEPERGMSVRAAIDDDAVGIGKHLRVAIGRRKRQHHHLARFEAAAVDLGLLDDLARHRR